MTFASGGGENDGDGAERLPCVVTGALFGCGEVDAVFPVGPVAVGGGGDRVDGFSEEINGDVMGESVTARGRPRRHERQLGRDPFDELEVEPSLGSVMGNLEHVGVELVGTEAATFDAAAGILERRSRDHSRRRTNTSDYLLGGLIVCSACGKHFIGTASNGSRYRYRYYTCYSRQRYGKDECQAERLPADELEAAVLNALLDVYDHSDLFDEAVEATRNRAGDLTEQLRDEMDSVDAEIRKCDDAIERYLHAFEAGTLPEAQCGERVRKLGVQAAELRARRSEIADGMQAVDLQAPSPETLEAVRAQLRDTIAEGSPTAKKALLQALVHEITAEGRHHIKPYFRVPNGTADNPAGEKVRVVSRRAPPPGLEPGHPPPEGGALSTELWGRGV